MARRGGAGPGAGRLRSIWEELRSSFGLPAGLAMVAGVVLGFGLPALDDLLSVDIPTFAFATQEAAAGLLETIATVTVAVAGLAFSVTVVAFTLTSSQLSPRVLSTFRSDRLSRAVLALFLGTFMYCLSLLVRLGVREGGGVPNLSITVALALAFASFVLFALFIAHIARVLQPSTVIAAIVEDASQRVARRYPQGVGERPERPEGAALEARERMRSAEPTVVEAEGAGYLTLIEGGQVVHAAARRGALVRQLVLIGDYVTPAQPLAEVWAEDLDDDGRRELARELRSAFLLGRQRTVHADVAFSVRQLADIALKGLSPGINDPSTAENAVEALTAVLVRFARSEQPASVRVDGEGRPRFVTEAPDLEDLVRLGFEQTRVFAAGYPVVSARLVVLLERIGRVARAEGLPHAEVERQIALLRQGVAGQVPTAADERRVREAGGDRQRR